MLGLKTSLVYRKVSISPHYIWCNKIFPALNKVLLHSHENMLAQIFGQVVWKKNLTSGGLSHKICFVAPIFFLSSHCSLFIPSFNNPPQIWGESSGYMQLCICAVVFGFSPQPLFWTLFSFLIKVFYDQFHSVHFHFHPLAFRGKSAHLPGRSLSESMLLLSPPIL